MLWFKTCGLESYQWFETSCKREEKDRTVINRFSNKGIYIPSLTLSHTVAKQTTQIYRHKGQDGGSMKGEMLLSCTWLCTYLQPRRSMIKDHMKMIEEKPDRRGPIKRHNVSQSGSQMGLFLGSRAGQKFFSDKDRKLSHRFLCRCTI